jgi:hypothetical protein
MKERRLGYRPINMKIITGLSYQNGVKKRSWYTRMYWIVPDQKCKMLVLYMILLNILTVLIKATPDNSSLNTVQDPTVDEAVFSMSSAPSSGWTTRLWNLFLNNRASGDVIKNRAGVSHSGLLCQPQMIGEGDCGAVGEWRLAGETEVLGENLPQRHFVPTNPSWRDPGSNPGRRGGKPATNRLSYGAAHSGSSVSQLWEYQIWAE